MSNIEDVFKELSEDCVKMLETRLYGGFKHKGIILIGQQKRCEEFLRYFNTATNNRYEDKIMINPNGRFKGKTFYPVQIDEIYDNLRAR